MGMVILFSTLAKKNHHFNRGVWYLFGHVIGAFSKKKPHKWKFIFHFFFLKRRVVKNI